ncbi:MAG TPA: TraB/GumN family protein [Chthoniobacterales bacterium]
MHLQYNRDLLVCWTSVLLLTFLVAGAAPAADSGGGSRHCLWRVTNSKGPVYLLGSIHAMSPGDYPLAPAIEDAVKQSQEFWFEIDPRPKAEALLERKIYAAARYPNGVQIKGKINPKTYAFLQKITLSGMNSWQHLKPWAIAMFLLRHPGYERISGAWGIDNHVAEEALHRGRLVGGIETVDEHVRVFSEMQEIEQEVFLLQTLIHADEGPKEFAQSVAAWKAGNVEYLYAMDLPQVKEAPTVRWRLLDRRNARWIPRIETVIKSGRPSMIVAGVAHFPGPHGLLALLRARGYKLEQL